MNGYCSTHGYYLSADGTCTECPRIPASKLRLTCPDCGAVYRPTRAAAHVCPPLASTRKAWFFKPGTEERIEVLHLPHAEPTKERWIIPCQTCGKNFTIRPDHGVTIGPDGALSTEHSVTCPVCGAWQVTMRRGVAQS